MSDVSCQGRSSMHGYQCYKSLHSVGGRVDQLATQTRVDIDTGETSFLHRLATTSVTSRMYKDATTLIQQPFYDKGNVLQELRSI